MNKLIECGVWGVSPTVTARDYKDPIKVLTMNLNKIDTGNETAIIAENRTEQNRTEQNRTHCRIVGQMDNTQDNTFESANRVYDKYYLAPTIPTCMGGGIQPKIITKRI